MSISQEPRVYVLLPVHGRRAITANFVRCLQQQSYANWHLLLIDDGSNDGTADTVRGLTSALTVLRGSGNWWWGGALHQGFLWLKARAAGAQDVVLIINDDTEMEPDFIAQAVSVLRPRSLLLAQLYNLGARDFVEVGVRADWKSLTFEPVSKPEYVNCQSTRGLFLYLSDFLKIGGFHPLVLPHYLSDYEFTMRACSKGFVMISDPSVRIFYDATTTGMHRLDSQPFLKRLRAIFSNRFAANPLHWTVFVLLRCPLHYVPRNLFRVWRNSVRMLLCRTALSARTPDK